MRKTNLETIFLINYLEQIKFRSVEVREGFIIFRVQLFIEKSVQLDTDIAGNKSPTLLSVRL